MSQYEHKQKFYRKKRTEATNRNYIGERGHPHENLKIAQLCLTKHHGGGREMVIQGHNSQTCTWINFLLFYLLLGRFVGLLWAFCIILHNVLKYTFLVVKWKKSISPAS